MYENLRGPLFLRPSQGRERLSFVMAAGNLRK